MLNDRSVIYISPLLFLIFALYMVPAFLSVWLLKSTEYFTAAESHLLIVSLQAYTSFKGLPNDVTAGLAQTLPALIGAVCFRRSSNQRLNNIGLALFVFLVASALLNLVALFFLQPDESYQSSNVVIGKDGLEYLETECRARLRMAMTYIFLFLGLQVSVKSEQK